MRLAVYTECVSPHQLPMAKEIAKILGDNDFRNIYDHPLKQMRIDMGWNASLSEKWELIASENKEQARNFEESAEVLFSSARNFGLFERRSNGGLLTVYYGERWFKPELGMLRLLLPSYFIKAWRFVRLLRKRQNVLYFPMGIHAAMDMARLCGLFAGDLRCLFRVPKLEFERRPGGRIYFGDGARARGSRGGRYCLNKMRMWGYVVAPSAFATKHPAQSGKCRILWVGRYLDWKRLDTIIRAVVENQKIHASTRTGLDAILDIYGSGPEEKRLKAMAVGYEDVIHFHPPVQNEDVRRLMHEHDVYVLSSNAYEGWGAVVSEALAEGMKVIGTYEAGSSGTMLPESNLFHVGDWKGLLNILKRGPKSVDSRVWSATSFANTLVEDLCK